MVLQRIDILADTGDICDQDRRYGKSDDIRYRHFERGLGSGQLVPVRIIHAV